MEDQQINSEKKKSSFNKLIEIYVWVFAAVLVIFPAYYYSLRYKVYDDFLLEFYNQFLLGAFLILIPILFRLIFGKLPFEYLRSKRENINPVQVRGDGNIIYTHPPKNQDVENYTFKCINESKEISETIFSRAAVYLLVGCIIAFTGVFIFYSPIFETTKSTNISQRLIDYLPRFGALFFIEFVAFFFLKQYRIMLEEYRYYEAIKRKRQDNLNLVDLIEKHKDNLELLKIITESVSQSVVTKLANGETTEVLETQKSVVQEFDIFSKFTDLIKEIKSK